MLRGFGLNILDESVYGRLKELTEIYCKNK